MIVFPSIPGEELYKSIQDAYLACIKKNCLPCKINRIVHVKVGSDYLPLDPAFVDTLYVNYKNPNDSFHLLMHCPERVRASLSSDE